MRPHRNPSRRALSSLADRHDARGLHITSNPGFGGLDTQPITVREERRATRRARALEALSCIIGQFHSQAVRATLMPIVAEPHK